MHSFARIRAKLSSLLRRDDFITGLITAGAIIVFVAAASRGLWPSLQYLFHAGGGADRVAATALLLDIALLLFAWTLHKAARKASKERAAAEQRAHLLGTRDLQTELLNRSALRERGAAIIDKAVAEGGHAALIVITLDRFRIINDVYDDGVGDALLRIVGRLLLNIGPSDALRGRLGSDEFAILSTYQPGGEGQILAFAEEAIDQLSRPIQILRMSLNVGVSIGIARLGYGCRDFTTLLRRADIAMNAAKASGRGRAMWFDTRMEQALRAQNEIEIGLRSGIPNGEFVPYFQPQVEFDSGRIRGFEMLARWQHPERGLVGPEEFIGIAEEAGLIGDLSETLMRAAFAEAKRWDPRLTLSVNISPRQLSDPLLGRKIFELLEETGFPADRLEIEITESSLVENMELAQSIVATLKDKGIRLSLDDFGTGYSSLAHLRALSFDRIKIDRSFVLALNKDPESWAMVQTIASLGRSMGIPVTVEGVESAAIELRVRSLGCDLGQGWFYGRAACAAQTRRLLAAAGDRSSLFPCGSPDEAEAA